MEVPVLEVHDAELLIEIQNLEDVRMIRRVVHDVEDKLGDAEFSVHLQELDQARRVVHVEHGRHAHNEAVLRLAPSSSRRHHLHRVGIR